MSASEHARSAFARAAELTCTLAACAAIVAYVGVALARRSYPFELEWQEGGVLDHVRRVASGTAIYTPPSLEFIAFPYTPLYYWISAAAAGVFGASFTTLRAVSFASSLACLAILFRLGQRETGSARAGLLAAGIYAATFRFAGAWFDVARVDSLCMAWIFAAIYVLRWKSGARAAAAGAVLFFAAFFTKQTALLIAPFVAIALWRRSRRDALVFAGSFAFAVSVSTLALNAQSDGWYAWYVFELLGGHAWTKVAAIGFWRETLVHLGAPVLLLIATRRAAGGWFEAWTCAGLVVAAWIGRAHVGGYDNTLMPACAAVAWRFGPALSSLFARGPLAAIVFGLISFGVLAYDPRAQVPPDRDRVAGEAIVAEIRAMEGEVFVPHHGYLARLAGKGSTAHAMAVIDLLQGADREVAARFVKELEGALQSRRWSAIVLDEPWHDDLPRLAENYRVSKTLFGVDDGLFVPVTGDKRRPSIVYVPRETK